MKETARAAVRKETNESETQIALPAMSEQAARVPSSQEYAAIYLSPHLDDVALSCGAQIYDRTAVGDPILILTIMAGDPPVAPLSPFAQALHTRWELATDVVAARREEDAAACAILGAAYAHWDTPDCIYRRHPLTGESLYNSNADIFGPVHTVEHALVAQLAARLRQLPPHRALYVPLGVGNHVDHQLVRVAAEQAAVAAEQTAVAELIYYEDYPYTRWEAVTGRAIDPADARWQAQVTPVSAEGVAARIDAVAAFVSQTSTFFNGRADLEAQIWEEVNRVGGEQLWRCLVTPPSQC